MEYTTTQMSRCGRTLVRIATHRHDTTRRGSSAFGENLVGGRASLAKWQTADPMGYPDGWNQFAYCGNGVTDAVDVCGAWMTSAHAEFFKYLISYDGRRIKDKYLSLIIAADKSVDDDQSLESTYKHAMKTYLQTPAEANELIDACIEGYVTGAESVADGYISGATLGGLLDEVMAAEIIVQEVGRASHVYQDRTCPAHYEDGEPHTWFGTWLIDWRHFPELFLYVPDSSIQQYKSLVEAIFRRVLKGNVELINEIFE